MLTCQRNKFREHVPAKHKHILSSWISESFLSTSFGWNEVLKQFCLSLNSLKWISNFPSRAASPERKPVETSLPDAEERRMMMVSYQRAPGWPRLSPCYLCGGEGRRKEKRDCSKMLGEPQLTCVCLGWNFSRHTKDVKLLVWAGDYVQWDSLSPASEEYQLNKWNVNLSYPGKKSGVLLLLYMRVCSQFKKKKKKNINKDFFFLLYLIQTVHNRW